jgi:hypothetical protein
MNELTLTLTSDQIELILMVIEGCNVEDLYEDNTDESVLDSTHDNLVMVQRYLLRKLG